MDRKSIRAYEDQEIPKEVRNAIIKGAMRAPTAGNMMMYSILDIEDQDLKEALAKSCDNQPMVAKAPLVLIFIADFKRWMDYFKVCDVSSIDSERGLEEGYKPGAGDFLLSCNDALIAAQNAVVVAESLGIGSCYIGDIMEHYEYHSELLELPEYTFPVTMLCFGYPTESQKRRKKPLRYPIESIVYKNRYKRLNEDEFKHMYKRFEDEVFKGKYLEGCVNIGQHYYKRKVTSDFMAEMNRSVETAIKKWCKVKK